MATKKTELTPEEQLRFSALPQGYEAETVPPELLNGEVPAGPSGSPELIAERDERKKEVEESQEGGDAKQAAESASQTEASATEKPAAKKASSK